MKRLALLVCLLIGTMAAHAQFEKGKWFVNPSVTGLNFSYNTETDKAHFGLEAKGGAFLVDNVALLIDAGAKWQGGGTDVYTLGVGGRYYISKVGVFLGAGVDLNRYDWDGGAIPSKSSREINKFISWDDFFHPMGQKNSSRKKK